MKKFTNIEFKALARDAEGNLVNMFDNFLMLTEAQIDALTEDDRYAYHGYMEELEEEMNALEYEFFNC